MKAIFFEKHGGAEVLKYGELPEPEPVHGEALVRVRAVALNRLDIWVRLGWKGLHLDMPHITGSDIAGEVVSVNVPGSDWKVGSRVVVNPGITTSEDEWTRRGEHSLSPGYRIIGEHLRGGMAELVKVPVRNLFRFPDTLSFEQAAALPLVALTCWRMLFKRAQIRPGETMLVVGSGGGVNSLAIKIGRHIGAKVYALAGSDEKAEMAKAIGADTVINYNTNKNWHAEILKLTHGRGVDVVVDNVGAATLQKSMRAATRGGRIVTVGNTGGHEIQFDNRVIFTKQLSYLGCTMGGDQDFVDALNFLWSNGIHAPIDQVAPLNQGIKMLQRMESCEHFGKIVLVP